MVKNKIDKTFKMSYFIYNIYCKYSFIMLIFIYDRKGIYGNEKQKIN